MFEQSILNQKPGARRPFALLVSVVLQVTLLALALFVPLVFTDVLPAAQLTTLFVLPQLPVSSRPAAPPPEAMENVRKVKAKPVATNAFVAPRKEDIPKAAVQIFDDPEIDPALEALARNLPYGPSDGKRNGSFIPGLGKYEIATASAPPPPPPPPVAEPKKREVARVTRSSTLIEAQAISRPSPPYPALAIPARIEGDVVLSAVIGVDGRIQELRVVSGHALLARAALETVARWRYSPTILNGEAVEVITQITVAFRLKR